MQRRVSGIGVLDKAVWILEASLEGANLNDLVSRSELPRATAHRLAQALELHRLLIRDESGHWYPGPRLVEFLSAGTADLFRTSAGPSLSALRAATGESAQLYLRNGDQRVCVAAADRSGGLRYTVPIGSAAPMTSGAATQALLAWEPREASARFLPDATFSPEVFWEVRRRGWAFDPEEDEGVASLAAPVRDHQGQVVAAVAIAGPRERMGPEPRPSALTALLRAARCLSGM